MPKPTAPPDRGRYNTTYHAYLFDLDGTLVDTAPDLNAALNHGLRSAGLNPVSIAHTRHWVGHGARALIREAMVHHGSHRDDEMRIDAALETFIDYYRTHIAELSQPYPTVVDTLQALRAADARLAIVTNKRTDLTEPLLAALNLRPLFDAVVCGDSAAQPKPAADPVYLALDQCGVPAPRALFVGDSETDVLAARAAGVDVVCVRDGYNHGVDVTTLHPDRVIDQMDELLS